MKKILFMCLIALGMMFVSCTKQKDSYYVKYVVSANHSNDHYGTSADIEILTEEGLISKTINGYFEETYGPYKYYDLTYLKVYCNHGPYSWNATRINGKIYVSKNEEPFVLKSEISTMLGGEPYLHPDTCELQYIIDF